MNLSPEWVEEFRISNIDAVHWSAVGRFDAADEIIMNWARVHDFIIFTHDLDFGTALALTNAEKPSVVQVRTQNVTVLHLSKMVISAINNHAEVLLKGALIVLEEEKKRIRILPFIK
jgi:predicted nuclease of predicted toxin-antitoxin system